MSQSPTVRRVLRDRIAAMVETMAAMVTARTSSAGFQLLLEGPTVTTMVTVDTVPRPTTTAHVPWDLWLGAGGGTMTFDLTQGEVAVSSFGETAVHGLGAPAPTAGWFDVAAVTASQPTTTWRPPPWWGQVASHRSVDIKSTPRRLSITAETTGSGEAGRTSLAWPQADGLVRNFRVRGTDIKSVFDGGSDAAVTVTEGHDGVVLGFTRPWIVSSIHPV